MFKGEHAWYPLKEFDFVDDGMWICQHGFYHKIFFGKINKRPTLMMDIAPLNHNAPVKRFKFLETGWNTFKIPSYNCDLLDEEIQRIYAAMVLEVSRKLKKNKGIRPLEHIMVELDSYRLDFINFCILNKITLTDIKKNIDEKVIYNHQFVLVQTFREYRLRYDQ